MPGTRRGSWKPMGSRTPMSASCATPHGLESCDQGLGYGCAQCQEQEEDAGDRWVPGLRFLQAAPHGQESL